MNVKRPSNKPFLAVGRVASSPSHARCVVDWLFATKENDTDPASIRALHDRAELLLLGLNALWDRARPSLGDTTVAVLFNRAFLAPRHEHVVRALGLHVSRRSCVAMDEGCELTSDLVEATPAIIIGVLEILARATAGALNPALHAALMSVDGSPESETRAA